MPSLLALMSLGLVLTLVLGRWTPLLLVPAGLFGLVMTPRRVYPLSTLRVRATGVGLSRAFELSNEPGTDRIWIWFLSITSFARALRERGVAIDGAPSGNSPPGLGA